MFVQTINISDVLPPVLANLPAAVVNVECADDVPALPFPPVVAVDNCGQPVDVELVEVENPGICPNQYSIIRRWTAEDDCGNATFFVQTINVHDNKAPVLAVMPVDRTYECFDEVPAAPLNQSATDNCVIAFVDFSESTEGGTPQDPNYSCPNNVTITRRWIATDLCGNTTEHIQTIRVHDTTRPHFLVTPVDRTYECLDDVEGAPDQHDNFAIDNCEVVFVDFLETRDNDSCHNQVIIKRRWEATDACGNKNTHWQYLTVYDKVKPTFRTTPVDRNYDCSEDVELAPVQIAQDNCLVVFEDFTETVAPGGCENQYVLVRRWEATDLCGNTNDHWQTITVHDDIKPTWTSALPADVTVQCGESVTPAAVTASDNCVAPLDIEMNETLFPGAGPNDGMKLTRIWIVTDVCGNSISHKQVVTIMDTQAPVLGNLPAATVSVECSEQVPAVAAVTYTDNCQGTVDFDFVEVEVPGTCANQYTVIRTWTAVDFAGNSTKFVQTINVSDTKVPTLIGLPAASVSVECSEQVPAVAVVTATDNCVKPIDVDFSEVEVPGTCPNQYVITRTWRASDDCGNATSFVQTITISDTKAPALIGLPVATVSVECSEAVPAVAVVTATDNCAAPVDVEFSEVEIPGTCSNQYSVTRTWTAEDDCGNITSFVQTITVNDTKAPALIGLPAATVSVECSEQVPAVAVVTATDNCVKPIDVDFSEVEIPGTCPNQYVITRTWRASDDCGNATSFVQTITISDTKAPALIGLPVATVSVECSEAVPAVAVVTATDNCAAPVDVEFSEVEIPGTCSNQYSVTRTWTAEDDCGNITSFVQTITVNDIKAPALIGLPAASVSVECSEQVPAVAVVTATDNCVKPIDVDFSEVEIPGTCANQYSITRTWRASDDCGNATSFVQTITISDTKAPVWTSALPADLTLQCGETVPAAATLTASDNCGAPLDIELSETTLPGAGPNDGGKIVRTWTAQDDCGNFTIHIQTILIGDTQAPVLVGTPAATVNVSCSEEVPAVANVTFTDNCQGTVTFDFSEVEIPGTCPNQYTIKRTWTATDFAGNSTQFVQTITINDTQAPQWNLVTPQVWINEIHYDNIGTDAGEFIEVAGTSGVDLSAYSLVLYNGANGLVYATMSLSGIIDNESNGFGGVSFAYPVNGVQNGSPDGIALVRNNTMVLQYLSYEGSFLAVDGVAAGMMSTDIGVAEAGTEPIGMSLSLIGNGNSYASFTWSGPSAASAGSLNIGQTMTAPAGFSLPLNVNVQCGEQVPMPMILTATDNCNAPVDVEYKEVFLPGAGPNDGLTIIRTWTAEDDCGNAIAHTQTITVNDSQAPVLGNLPPATVNVQCSTDIPAVAAVTVTDNCQGTLDMDYSESLLLGNCINQYTLTRTWTATDFAGNTTKFVQTINVSDTQAPVWNQPAPSNATVSCAADVPAAPAQTATDNCGVPVITDFSEIVQPGNCLNRFTLVRTWHVQDDCGNATSRQQTITVNDNITPVMSCPAPLQAQCSPAEQPPYANLTEFTSAGGSATDNCGLNVNSFGLLSEIAAGNVYTRTYRVVDQCGNAGTCQQTVTVLDTQAPIFLNCPTGPLVFGNDPDQCSAKINWPQPVAVDNCSIPTVVQTAGPTAGSVVPVGTYTVTFRATDARGNVSFCTFTVMVMDTEKPEFDADIVMPGDITVECDAVPAPFVLTNNDVNDNCTPSNLLVITFTEVRTNGNCPFNYTLTRTWRVTDQAGNQLVHIQVITVRDTKPPTAICQNATVTLDKAGTVSITPGQINNGSFDNCTTQANLTFTVTPSTFTCANLGANTVTLRVTDQCGNFATCTAIVTVLEGIGPCVPQYSAVTSCKNNATTMDNGQFIDLITIKSLAMQTWTVISNTGLYLTSSANPPAAPLPLPVGTTFTMGVGNDMVNYRLSGVHVDGIGYSITVQNNLGQTATISNKAFYPTPIFLNLDGPFCLNTTPFQIQVGEAYGAAGVVVPGSIMVNGVVTTTFNAGTLGVGTHTVMATFDASPNGITTNLVINGILVGGTVDQALADPGCQQKITKFVQVVTTPTTIVCNDLVHVSISNDGGNCVFKIAPDNVMEGSYLCDDDYTVVITYPAGTNTYNPADRVDNTHIGKTLNYTLVHSQSGNICWGKIKVEDKEDPKLTCPANITIACSAPTEPSFTGQVLVSDCSQTNTVVTDDFTDFGACVDPRAQIVRLWLVTDASGNQSTCTQRITIAAFNLNAVVFPADVTINCATANSTDPSVTGSPSIQGSPIGQGGLCMASISRTDDRYEICPGSYEIVRIWKVRNMCLPLSATNPREHQQVIKVIDTQGPTFDCPAAVTVSTDPFSCCATAALPDVLITETCSYVTSLEYKVVGTDFATGNLVIYEGTGSLSDFAGNNHWVPDTMGVFGFTQCLPRGEYDVTYTAIDACGNISKCSFKLYVEDQIPPIAVCDEFTQVALGADGMAFVNAHTFNDGSYDVCESVHFKARRMDANDCQSNEFFLDQVKFCCDDINDTVLVVFRAYDIPVPAGSIGQDEYEGHYNDCMVKVFVEDKIKPLCNAPAQASVSCESFDPSLWAYGFATGLDNCCLDTITETRNITLFDTVCNRGTITRTFRVFDCGGNSSSCTQRVIVAYEQDYFVKFPNDAIVTACDGTGNFGEPTFFGVDCELLGVSHKDDTLKVVPDACYLIERTWTIINWCTYNPNAGCINVPNPNPNPNSQSTANLPGPTVSAAGTPAPWAPSVVAITPGATPTNYSTFWSANANCYTYKQTIKIIDTQKPVIENCPTSPVDVCDITPNNAELWNAMYWWDNVTGSHDLCEGPTDLTITATDLCSGANVNVRYLLFLDLDNNGDMETVINSSQLPGFNNVNFGNGLNPNFSGGTPSAFDFRPVPANQKYGFALQTTTSGNKRTASVRWNTSQALNTYTIPELPYGTHKIKWIVDDGCGNDQVCEYTFIVKDCKKPTVVCINGLSVNIMPTKMIQMGVNDFLLSTSDNCTPTGKLVTAIRKAGQGTGFPLNPDGTPQKSVTFTCTELGKQNVEVWSMDLAGNADFCVTFVDVQDNMNNCNSTNATVAGALKTEAGNGLEEANVELDGTSPTNPSVNMLVTSDDQGQFIFGGVPQNGDYTVTPIKDNDPLNGVSTFDLVLINKHILGIEPLNSPFKMISADANNSRSITTFDIVELRKLILGIYTELPNNTSWRFVDKSFAFPNIQNPFQTIFPETKQLANLLSDKLNEDFVAMKVGDVNGNAVTSSLFTTNDRSEGTLLFDVQDRKVKAGEVFTVNFRAADRATGYQFTLNFPNMEVVDVTPISADMAMLNFGIFNSENSLTTSFDNERVNGEFAVTFRAKATGTLSQMLAVSGRITKAEAYSLNRERQAVALRFNGENGSTVAGLGFELYQNQPNPWMNKTQVGFHLPEAANATLTIYDETGRTLFVQKGEFNKGYNAFSIDRALVNTTGVLYYQLETATDSAVKKMIQTK
ncbi:MAG: HYR domain-containing protein [Saprospiraceae bacterium]